MSRFFNPSLCDLEVYTPGEQPKDKKYIKLNTNESPYPAPKEVTEAVNKDVIEDLRLYCNPDATELKDALAREYGVNRENVFVANGSDDILNFSFLAFGKKGVAFPDVSYGFYEVFARLHGLECDIVPLKSDFSISAEDYFDKKGKLIAIANPNAPTGMTLSLSEVEKIVIKNPESVVLIDEAYVDFGAQSCVELCKKYDNLLCVQTFSKSRSMAGARLGFAIGSASLIEDLDRIKYSTNPYNVNTMTQTAGVAALKRSDYFKENCNKIIATREFVKNELEALGFTVLSSKANFIFAKSDKIGGAELYGKLKEKGILIRHFEKERIKEFNRITIGSREEMEAFLLQVKEILGERK